MYMSHFSITLKEHMTEEGQQEGTKVFTWISRSLAHISKRNYIYMCMYGASNYIKSLKYFKGTVHIK